MTTGGGVNDPLAALPRTRAGYPVPWITEWHAPTLTRPTPVRDDPRHGTVLACSCRIGSGRPLLGQQCVERQRDAMMQRRCQTCGHHIAADTPATFVAGRPAAGNPGVTRPAYVEPPMHADCAAAALRACPILDSGRATGTVYVITAFTYELFERRLLIRPGTEPGSPEGEFIVVPLGDPFGPLQGPLEFLVAVPQISNACDANAWLDTRTSTRSATALPEPGAHAFDMPARQDR